MIPYESLKKALISMEIHAKVMILMLNLFIWRLAARGVRPGSFYDVAIHRNLYKWYQNLSFGASGDHGSNICIEIGTRAIRRRAEGCLYVWEIVFTVQRDPCTSLETAFTVQRALCTFRGEGHPVQKGHPCHPGAAKVGPNLLKFQVMKKTYKEP